MATYIPKSSKTGEVYECIGERNWTDIKDLNIRTYGSIFKMPIDVDLQHDSVFHTIVPASQKDKYYHVTFGVDYLLERYYQEWKETLGWDDEACKLFIGKLLEYFEKRNEFQKEQVLKQQAAQLAIVLGVSEEVAYAHIQKLKTQPVEEPESTILAVENGTASRRRVGK